MIPRARKPKWEKALPGKLTIATMEEVSTQGGDWTTDNTERKSVIALLDSSTMGECINRDYPKSQWFNLLKLTNPIPVYNVDRSPNKAGSIIEVVSLILRYKNHSKRTLFCITSLCYEWPSPFSLSLHSSLSLPYPWLLLDLYLYQYAFPFVSYIFGPSC